MSRIADVPNLLPHAPASAPSRVRVRLWFGLLGAPIAWTAHEIVGAAVIGRSCDLAAGFAPWRWTTLAIVSLAAVVIAAAAAVVAFRTYRGWVGGGGLFTARSRDSVELMSRLGFLVSLLLLFNIVLFGVAPLVVDPCIGAAV
jgi:hypothetical protein